MFQITLAAARVNAGLKQEPAAEKIGVTAKHLVIMNEVLLLFLVPC